MDESNRHRDEAAARPRKTAPGGAEGVRSIFSKFRRILDLNTRILGEMAEMERALGGEYIFDQAFLEKSAHRILVLAHQVIYSVNALAEHRYIGLFDRYETIRATLLAALAGDPGPFRGSLALPFEAAHWETLPETGMRAVCLAEMFRQSGLPPAEAPDGLVLTKPACRLVLESNGLDALLVRPGLSQTEAREAFARATLPPELLQAMEREVLALFDRRGKESPLRLLAIPVFDPDQDLSRQPEGPVLWIHGVRPSELPAALLQSLATFWTAHPARDAETPLPDAAVVVAAQDFDPADTARTRARVTTLLRDAGRELVEVLAGPAIGMTLGQTAGPTFDPTRGPTFDPTFDPTFGPTRDQSLDQTLDPTFGQMGGQAFGQTFGQTFGETGGQTFSQTGGQTGGQMLGQTLDQTNGQPNGQTPHPAETDAAGPGSDMATHPAANVIGSSQSLPPGTERRLLRRTPPHEPVESRIAPTTLEQARRRDIRFSGGEGGGRRGSSPLGRARLEAAVAMAMALERTLGLPLELHCIEDDNGGLVPWDLRPLPAPGEQELDDKALAAMERELGEAQTLLRGGETAQFGVAAGRVIHVSAETDPWEFPRGAVAVARHASPRLSPLLQRAAALVTEAGGTAGHLATIAREYRVPAIFGAPGALDALPEGREVTVDAEECVVHAGILESLLAYRASGAELYPTDPEYILLRQLLRWITPLNLLDPDSPEFVERNCRTVHDLIHFSHERAVEELLHLQQRQSGLDLRRLDTRRLVMDAPLDIRVLDVEGGAAETAEGDLRLADLRCPPLRAFLRGLEFKDMWDREPAALKLRHILSAMDKSADLLSGNAVNAGQNLAIVSGGYMNLSLRLGYHFSVVDALLTDDPDKNSIYFRFAGGMAEAAARRRRAELIRVILEGLEFRVALEGDLVVGKLKMGDRQDMERALTRLGELTGFTRQLDVNMASQEDVDAFAALFLERIQAGRREGREES